MKLQCPHCKTAFQVDDNDYAAIASQVKDAEFNRAVERRLTEIEEKRRAEEHARQLDTEREIDRLKAIIEGNDATRRAEQAEQTAAHQRQLDRLAAAKDRELFSLKSEKDTEIASLQQQIASANDRRELELEKERTRSRDAVFKAQKDIEHLKFTLEKQKSDADNELLRIRSHNAEVIRVKDEEIAYYKEQRNRLSTKLLGESLEVHCQTLFDRARSMGQFATAYFEKDNDSRLTGTKGDFIFRDYLDGQEYISIMFEMKTEDPRTTNKHRNADFFAKLDKDRRDKNCEYAVLVTMLEADNELYNEGIVDVSYRYDKMYVIRPQFFMAVISMLSRSAMRGARQLVGLRDELTRAREQTIDVTNFERRRDKFVENFGKLVGSHLKKQDEAIEALDKAIAQAERQAANLRKIKETFEASRQKLIRANESAQNDFTIKKLTHGNPTMRAKFEEARRLAGEAPLNSIDDLQS